MFAGGMCNYSNPRIVIYLGNPWSVFAIYLENRKINQSKSLLDSSTFVTFEECTLKFLSSHSFAFSSDHLTPCKKSVESREVYISNSMHIVCSYVVGTSLTGVWEMRSKQQVQNIAKLNGTFGRFNNGLISLYARRIPLIKSLQFNFAYRITQGRPDLYVGNIVVI